MIELAELVPTDKPLTAQLNARAAAYKALRCLYLADSYRAISKWTEVASISLSLFLLPTALTATRRFVGFPAVRAHSAVGERRHRLRQLCAAVRLRAGRTQ
jgi:hypothetical protein